MEKGTKSWFCQVHKPLTLGKRVLIKNLSSSERHMILTMVSNLIELLFIFQTRWDRILYVLMESFGLIKEQGTGLWFTRFYNEQSVLKKNKDLVQILVQRWSHDFLGSCKSTRLTFVEWNFKRRVLSEIF